jgi:hypothetical protein
MQRWVGLGVISDNLVNIGLVMSKRGSAQDLTPSPALQTLAARPGGFYLASSVDQRPANISTNMRMRLKLASIWASAQRLGIRPHLSDVG